MTGTVHQAPGSSGITACCGKHPDDLPAADRIARDWQHVTCTADNRSGVPPVIFQSAPAPLPEQPRTRQTSRS